MRSTVWSRGSMISKLASVVVISACSVLPADVQSQDQVGFLVIRSLKDGAAYYLVSASCKNVNLKDYPASFQRQTVECVLERNECKPGKCKFEIKSDDLPPLPIVFGVSSYNPPCGWSWDEYRKTYIFTRC